MKQNFGGTSSRQIAYEVYVELKTRAIGYPIDLEHDTIVELYDSWYKAFLLLGSNEKIRYNLR